MSTFAHLASQAPAWVDLLHQVGLQRRRTRAARAASVAGWFGLGLIVGGGLAVLLTPRSGPQMRERIGEQARRAREYVTPESSGAAAADAGNGPAARVG